MERPLIIQEIRNQVRGTSPVNTSKTTAPAAPDPETVADLFHIHTLNKWMTMEKDSHQPQMLFDKFWIEGELCILFADTNMGKSILAVQLGDSITRGRAIAGFKLSAKPTPVLYIDFELSSKQFEQRYTDKNGTYHFHDTFHRGEYNQLSMLPMDQRNYDDYVIGALTRGIKTTGATVLIIDNITCLRKGTQSASEALPLMKKLKYLKTRHGLSILVLAHTPKRNTSIPITRNDLQGSKMIMNFADSAFAIGESQTTPGYRYLKQIKQRSTTETYGADNICLLRLEHRNRLLQFTLSAHGPEHAHLRRPDQQDRERTARQVADLHRQGYTQRKIAAKLQLGLATVNRMISWVTEGGEG